MNTVVILILVHKADPDEKELQSLRRCFEILGSYDIVLICPSGLNITKYKVAIPYLSYDYIDPTWQSSYRMFNRLKILPFIYQRYQHYKFILFYELDAWVFRDELSFWCDQRYDFIGAPWFEGWDKATPDSKCIGIGNGGFSLRKVESHLRVLNTYSYIRKPWSLLKSFIRRPTPLRFKDLVLNLTVRNNTLAKYNDYEYQEDHFWGLVAAENFEWFRVPDEETALRFSVEVNPHLFIKSEKDLPFGCHGWWKYEPAFWQKYIPFTKPASEV